MQVKFKRLAFFEISTFLLCSHQCFVVVLIQNSSKRQLRDKDLQFVPLMPM